MEKIIFNPEKPFQIINDAVKAIGPRWAVEFKNIPGTPKIETIQFQKMEKTTGKVEEYYHYVPFLGHEKRTLIQEYYLDLYRNPSLQIFLFQYFIKSLIDKREMIDEIFTIFKYEGDLYRLRLSIDVSEKKFKLTLYKQSHPTDSLFTYKGLYVGGIILK